MLFVFQDSLSREDIGDGFFRHHAARECVNAAVGEWDRAGALAVGTFDVHVLEKAEPGKVAARDIAVAVVDVGHLGAEAADVDRRVVMDQPFAFETMKHAEYLLGFAHRENRNQH